MSACAIRPFCKEDRPNNASPARKTGCPYQTCHTMTPLLAIRSGEGAHRSLNSAPNPQLLR